MDINDSVVLVTGGTRGLGKSLIQAFLDAGAKKIYVGSRTPIETLDPRLQPIQLDITNAHDIAAAVDQCQDVTILVNNAGVGPVTTFLTAPSLKEARDTMETNYFGTLAMARAFAPILKRNGATNGGTVPMSGTMGSLAMAGSGQDSPLLQRKQMLLQNHQQQVKTPDEACFLS